MRAPRWIVASGFLFASGTAFAGSGLPVGHDDAVYLDDLVEASPARRVDVVITDQGPRPRDIPVAAFEDLELVLTRASADACRSDVLVQGHDVRASVPAGHPVSVTLRSLQRGELHLSCPVEDVVGALGSR